MSDATAVLATRPAARSGRSVIDRWFYVGVALFVLALNIVSFGPSIVEPSNRTVPLPLPPLVVVHAAVSVAWLILLPLQATLVATNRTALHRRLGIAGVVLAAALVVTGPFVLIGEARRGFDLSGDLVPRGMTQEAAAILPALSSVVLFALLVGGAVWYRRHPDVHKRLMLFAALGPLSGAALAHLAGHWAALRPWGLVIAIVGGNALLAIVPVFDRLSRGRVHRVSLWGAILIAVWFQIFFGMVPATAAWHDFAEWLVH